MSVAAVVAVFAGFIGLAVLFLFGVDAFHRIRSLGRAVALSSERIAAAGATPPYHDEESGEDPRPNVW